MFAAESKQAIALPSALTNYTHHATIQYPLCSPRYASVNQKVLQIPCHKYKRNEIGQYLHT